MLGEREVVLAREITKTYETFLNGSFDELLDALNKDSNQQRGEMVLMVSGADKREVNATLAGLDTMIKSSLKYLGVKQTSSLLSDITGLRKKEIYQRALEISE